MNASTRTCTWIAGVLLALQELASAAEPPGKPPAPPQVPASAAVPKTPEKSDSGKPARPGGAVSAKRSALTGPGTQTEDDAYVGVRRK